MDPSFRGKPGIYAVPADRYHADELCDQPTLSASIAHLLCERTPLHAWTAHPRLNPDFERKHETKFDLGTAAHAVLLEGRPFEDVARVLPFDSWRTNAAKDMRDEARVAGKVPLLEKDAAAVLAMVVAAREQLEQLDVSPTPLVDGKPEQTLIWEEDGVTCRALVDWLHDAYGAVDDLKTTSASADPARWSRTAFTIGADVQTAFYLRGLSALTGAAAELRYIVLETYPPYALSVCSLAPDALTVGASKVEQALKIWKRCLESGEWPGYTPRVAYAELPPWEDARWAERMWSEEEAAA